MKRLTIRFNAPIILTFSALCLLSLVLYDVSGGVATSKYFSVYRSSMADPLTYLRLFSHVVGFIDSKLFLNAMLLILLVGPPLEEKYHSGPLAMAIIITAVVTGLFHILLFPGQSMMGANAVIFMMIVLSSFTEMKSGGIPVTMILVVILYLGEDIMGGLKNTANPDQLINLIGGACGLLFGFMLNFRKPGGR